MTGRCRWWTVGLLALALVIVETTALPIPAWVPMGIALLIANYRYAAFTKQEKRDLWIGAVFAVFCAGLIIVGARKFFANQPKQAAERTPKWGWVLGMVRETRERLVLQVVDDYPIAKAGVHPGDVIESLNGVPSAKLQTQEALFAVLDAAEKDGLTIRLRRLGEKKPMELKVTLP
jgi:PDZ domain